MVDTNAVKACRTRCCGVEEAMHEFISKTHTGKGSVPLSNGYGDCACYKQDDCCADGNLGIQICKMWQSCRLLLAHKTAKGVADVVEKCILQIYKYRKTYTTEDNEH